MNDAEALELARSIEAVREHEVRAIADCYNIQDVEALDELIRRVDLEMRCGTSAPGVNEDPIPQMREMATTLRDMFCADDVRGRIFDAIIAYRDHSFVTAEGYFVDILDQLDILVDLLADVPVNRGGKPKDVLEFLAVRKLCEFWNSLPMDRANGGTLTAKFEGVEARSRGGAFVCDVIECAVAGVRDFSKTSTAYDTSDADACRVRKSVVTQIRNYLIERHAKNPNTGMVNGN